MRATIHVVSRGSTGASPRASARPVEPGSRAWTAPWTRPPWTPRRPASSSSRRWAARRQGAGRPRLRVPGSPGRLGRPRAGAAVGDLGATACRSAGPRGAVAGSQRQLAGRGPGAPRARLPARLRAGSLADIASWAGISVGEARAGGADLELVRYRDEQGRELLDLPGAPLPDPDTPAPVRFLPHWDANLLVHARRTGLLPEEHRPRVFSDRNPFSVGTYLVDGRVVGAWSLREGRVELEPFEAVSARGATPSRRSARRSRPSTPEAGDLGRRPVTATVSTGGRPAAPTSPGGAGRRGACRGRPRWPCS